MHAWSARTSAALAAIEAAGFSRPDIAKITGAHRSQVGRWFSGEHRPGYDNAMRIAGAVRREHPHLADEFVAAAGFGGPVEPAPGSPVPRDVLAAIRKTLEPDDQERAIAALEETLRGPSPSPDPPGGAAASAPEPGEAEQPGPGAPLRRRAG